MTVAARKLPRLPARAQSHSLAKIARQATAIGRHGHNGRTATDASQNTDFETMAARLSTMSISISTSALPIGSIARHLNPARLKARPRPHNATTTTSLSRAAHTSHRFFSVRPARHFHNYFVTHLPQSSLHPDSGPRHNLPRAESTPHPTPRPRPGLGSSSSPTPLPATPPNIGPTSSRDLTVVRIPIRSARHHFGAYESRGSRPYNEDTHQAGTIDLPAFATRSTLR